jgi:hypothetical protein
MVKDPGGQGNHLSIKKMSLKERVKKLNWPKYHFFQDAFYQIS